MSRRLLAPRVFPRTRHMSRVTCYFLLALIIAPAIAYDDFCELEALPVAPELGVKRTRAADVSLRIPTTDCEQSRACSLRRVPLRMRSKTCRRITQPLISALFVNCLELLVDYLASVPIDRNVQPVALFSFNNEIGQRIGDIRSRGCVGRITTRLGDYVDQQTPGSGLSNFSKGPRNRLSTFFVAGERGGGGSAPQASHVLASERRQRCSRTNDARRCRCCLSVRYSGAGGFGRKNAFDDCG